MFDDAAADQFVVDYHDINRCSLGADTNYVQGGFGFGLVQLKGEMTFFLLFAAYGKQAG